VKLDITFQSLRQLEQQAADEMQDGRRAPMIAGGLILFDKTGRLAELNERADTAPAPVYNSADMQFDQFILYHANDKVERPLTDGPESSLYIDAGYDQQRRGPLPRHPARVVHRFAALSSQATARTR
jgi:hypothetical protein